MSKTMVTAPIIAALLKSEDILGRSRKWTAVNGMQAEFIEKFFSKKEEIRLFSEQELRSWASRLAVELNAILEREGFDIRLQDFRPNEFGVVSILDVLVAWLIEGQKTGINFKNRDYPAVSLKPIVHRENQRPLTIFSVFDSPSHADPVAVVYTKSGDRVCMTVADRAFADFDLIGRIDEIRSDLRPAGFYDWLKFPMVDLNQEVDISWLKEMRTIAASGEAAVISRALQQTKFKMNQFGARVKSAVAIAIGASSIRHEQGLAIDRPFFLWIERSGLTMPVMYAYINEKDWKDPGDLADM